MRWIFSSLILFCIFSAAAQDKEAIVNVNLPAISPKADSLIKDTLIKMAMAYPAIAQGQELVNLEKYSLKRAKSAWLDMVSIQGNINEFVINKSDNANFFPKYNLGLNMPLGIFGRTSAEVNMAKSRIGVANARKDMEVRALKKDVLSRYETYKEKRQLLELQQSIAIDQSDKYKIIQRQYSNDKVELAKVNEGYQDYLRELSKMHTLEKDLNIAELELEELIGADLPAVIQAVLNKAGR
jgi:outer membrane protein TolC